MSTEAAECRSCGADIIWAETKNGKMMPVDSDPSPNGNVELHEYHGLLTAIVHGAASVASARERAELHLSHFKTCPKAGSWRR